MRIKSALLSLALMLACLIPQAAWADSTTASFELQNNTDKAVYMRISGDGNFCFTVRAGNDTFADLKPTAYFLKHDTYTYDIKVFDGYGNEVRFKGTETNIWNFGPRVTDCTMKYISGSLPGTQLNHGASKGGDFCTFSVILGK